MIIETVVFSIVFILTPVFFFMIHHILKKKKVGKEKYHGLIAFVLTCLFPLLLLGIYFGYLAWLIANPPFSKVEFSEEKWKETTWGRYEMMRSIQKQKLLIGKTSDEVTDLLGEKLQYIVQNEHSHTIVYPSQGASKIHMFYMIIYLENDKVIKVETRNRISEEERNEIGFQYYELFNANNFEPF